MSEPDSGSSIETTGTVSTFARIDSRSLKPITVVAQCLDNQWVAQEHLDHMLAHGLSFEDQAVAARRFADSRAEYLRALLNAEQVVVNRAYFVNNPVVYGDFASAGPRRDAFLKLLNTAVLVPFLTNEESPAQLPEFTTDPHGRQAWESVLSEAHLSCLRLSWDRAENERSLHDLLFRKVRTFVGRLAFLEPAGLANDFGLDADQAAGLMAVLREASIWAMDDEHVTREKFYRRFVVADDSDPALGRFDAGKPFASVLKQLVDLRYGTNLPDAIDRYPLTPADSLHRTALQEERQISPHDEAMEPAELAALLLRRRAFDLVQRPLQVSLTGLDLPHVWQARQTDEWSRYIVDLRRLVREPEQFDTHAQAVYDSYTQLAGELAGLVADRHRDFVPSWRPVIKVVVEAVGATLSVLYSGDPVIEVVGKIAGEVAARASTVVVRFVVVNADRRRSRNELSTGIEIMRVKFARTQDDWDELVARLRAGPIPMVAGSIDTEDDAGMDQPGESDG